MLAKDPELARHNMVVQQIRPWDVIDERVLEVVQAIPRERFVPPAYLGLAFADIEVPLAHDQAMMPPKLEARMMQALAIRPEDTVLEVGTGSGFVTACLARLARQVTSLEIHPDLSAAAAERLEELGIGNAELRVEDAFNAEFDGDGFDVIILTGSLPVYTDRFERLLKPGGRLFAVIGSEPAMEATLVTRIDADAMQREGLFETVVVPLINAPQPEAFVF
jgi:protein-L-isoaspartate(D-aspartate) O-methyltransferase